MENITLRDLFAAKATDKDIEPYLHDYNNLTWMPAGSNGMSSWPGRYVAPSRTREEARFMFADAMIKQREKK